MGSYFYIPTHNGSTDVVTNSVGEVVARYAYEPFIVGRYAGAGACNKVRPGKQEAVLILAGLLSSDESVRLKALVFLLYLRAQSPRGLSLADSVSRLHDRDSPNFMHSSRTQGNNAFIRRNTSLWVAGGMFGPIPTARTWDKTFQRERDALPGWAGDGSFAEFAAGINTIGTLIGDYTITVLGTALFWTTNQLNYLGMAVGNWAKDAPVPPGGINLKMDLGKLDFGNLGSARMKFSISIDQNRFKYLEQPSKCTL